MKCPPRIALIADDLTSQALAPDAKLLHLTPANWRWQLSIRERPDFFLVESAWRGFRNSWQGLIVDSINKPHKKSNPLKKILLWCQKNNIPTVFWNKEDPVCFERFSKVALQFDVVYTTDEASIPKYYSLPGQQFTQVRVLPFGAQPALYQPDKDGERTQGIAFAGGFYGEEHPERSQLQTDILTALMDAPLTIYDRFWTRGKKSSFPFQLKHRCIPAVPQKTMARVYNRHQLYLNFNTISHSPTMLSRRVFELAACASPMISTPSPALQRFFGDSIPQVSNGEEASHWCSKLLADHPLRQQTGQRLYESVMDQHTWVHRLEQIRQETGFF